MANEESGFANGGDNSAASAGDLARAQDLALRYRCEFVDLHKFTLQPGVFKKVPVHLMFRYNFVPLKETRDGRIAIAVADPTQLMLIDEISLLLGKRIITQVATLAQIAEILNTVDKTRGVEENPAQISDPPDDWFGASNPDAPVRAPLKPKPHRRSGATAVPEQDDLSASSASR
jgi:Type II secretion system (T2SS), protein E, N-terminal domain